MKVCFLVLLPELRFLIPLLCSVLGLVGLVSILLLIIWHHKMLNKRTRKHRSHLLMEQKSNNEPQEEVTRFRNPLFETDKGGGTGNNKDVSTELIEIELDIEKYEKSPKRVIRTSNKDTNNDSKQNTPQLKMPKKKNINVEISRTMRQLESEVEV